MVPTRRYDFTWLDSKNWFRSRLRQTNTKRQTDRQTQNSFLHSNNNNFMFCQWKRWTQPNLISTFFSLLLFLCSQVTRYPSTTNQPRVQLLTLIPPIWDSSRYQPLSSSCFTFTRGSLRSGGLMFEPCMLCSDTQQCMATLGRSCWSGVQVFYDHQSSCWTPELLPSDVSCR